MQAHHGRHSGSQGQPARRNTASSLLARVLPNQNFEHKMATATRSVKPKSFSYAQYDGTGSSPPRTPERSSQSYISVKDAKDQSADELDQIIYADRKSSAGHGLRPRKSLTLSVKAAENGDKTKSKAASKRPAPSLGAKSFYGDEDKDELSLTPIVTERIAVRQQIASVTAAKRNRFFVEKKDYFLPLLPPGNNFVKKLVEKHNALSQAEKARIPVTTPYEEIENQPKGIRATMKPYQLSGLSFLVYLHRNGLSGILGDEMGLGKTLQTLSLIQYLKENEPKTGAQLRPFLVVCPLSVLSSWMAEARKWAPGLKVLRFHGPVKERDRLKKIASGEIDMFGNLTSKQKAKLKTRRTAAGKPIISLDSDSEPEEVVGVDLVITTYESYQAEQGWFKRAFVWRYVVLDEGHKIKNDLSLISKALQGLQAEYRLILTGTPLQNNLAELWALLHWLYQDIFTDQSNELFRTSFDLTKGLYSNRVLDDSRHLLELIMLRRMKNSPGVDLNLPPKTEVLLFVPLTPMQRFWYTRLITRADQGLLDELFRGAKHKERAALKEDSNLEAELIKKDAEALELLTKDMVIGSDEWKESREILARTIEREKENNADTNTGVKNSAWQKLMNLLMQLRKVCNHPYQIPNAEPVPYELGDHIIRASGKFIVLEKLIAELVIKQRKKILIFSGFTKMLDLVEEFLLVNGGDGTSYRSVRLDGSTARARRNLGIRMFNDNSSDYRVMLISTRAGGLGINLATASDVVMLDQDWNPQITLQAEARAHRIGQTNPVTVYKLISQGTVEEQMMGRIQKKLYLSAKVTESMQDIHTKAGRTKKGPGGRVVPDDDMPQLSTGQLMALVRRGASALSKPEIDVNEMLSWDWETTVVKCKDQPADLNVQKDAISDAIIDQEAEKKWLSEMEKVESYIFEGKKLERSNGRGAASTKDIAGEWNRADRRIGKNTTVLVDGFAINKESMQCKDWEAVPTMAGKDPRLAEPKRAKKAEINSQSHCQVCLDGGELHICKMCPRSYHFGCLDREFKAKTNAWQFVCPQHQCNDCEQKTTDAGGMLYRCRWCERAFCEDCLDWEKTQLIGENLIEYELLNYPTIPQAFYIQCHACTDHFVENPADQAVCVRMASEMEKEYERAFGAADSASQVGSLTDAATIETTGANTPIVIDDDFELLPSKKRKLEGENHLKLSFKREKLEPDLPARRSFAKRETLEEKLPARRNSVKREDLVGSSPARRSSLKSRS